ncbi:MAG: hypothetical protein HXO22_06270 [Prevotella sp.]|nr:hypothetical protein [Prevotella sp.]MBF1585357.1 hypothetical protein [Prevotella sp.]
MVECASNPAAQTPIRLVMVGRGIAHLFPSHQPQCDSTFANAHQAMLRAVSSPAVPERT